MPKLPLEVQDGLKERIANHIKTYEVSELDEHGNPVRPERRGSFEEEKIDEEDMD